MSEQHNKNGKSFIFFILFSLSSLLSHHFIIFSLISHSSSYIPINLSSFLLSLFFLLSYCFSLFLSASPRHLLDLMPISIAVGFFFFFFSSDLMGVFGSGWVQMVMSRSVVGGSTYGWVAMVMGKSVVVGFDVRILWWVGQFVDGL